MQRNTFLAQHEVEAFIEWLIQALPTLSVDLNFKSSKFVPGGLRVSVSNFEQLLGHYRWIAAWQPGNEQTLVHSGCWISTRTSLQRLSNWLSDAVEANDHSETYLACLQVLRWGGVKGAIPFLKRLTEEQRLTTYLKSMRAHLALDGAADLNNLNGRSVERFDSGMTKIHALLDTSGSPIYDSRVGAAMAMLHTLFRTHYTSLHRQGLVFPSGAARGSQIRNPGAFAGVQHAPQLHGLAYHEWAKKQLQLGWIIRAVLERTNWFFAEGSLAARCHAFEASLFMLGYDLRCFAQHHRDQHPV